MEHFYYGQHSPSRVRHLATTPIEQRSYYRQPPPPFASSSLLLSRSGEYQNYDTDDDQLQQEPPTTFHRYRSASAAYNSEQSNFSGSAKGPAFRASSIYSAAPSIGGSCRSRRADSHNAEGHKSRNVGSVKVAGEEEGKNLFRSKGDDEDHNILLPNSVGKGLLFLLLLVAIIILLLVFTSSDCDTIALSCCGLFSYITKSLQTNIKLTHYSAPPI